jgi:hypothetical protein
VPGVNSGCGVVAAPCSWLCYFAGGDMALNEELYSKELTYKSASVISGQIEMQVIVGDENLPWQSKLIQAFLADDDIQHMQFTSSNIGFVKSLQKQYKSK